MSYRDEKGGYTAEAVVGSPMPCSFCGEVTKHEALRMFGARCVRCYRAYCESASKPAPDVGDKRKGNPKEWAYALKAREESGERLSSVQRSMWRSALGVTV